MTRYGTTRPALRKERVCIVTAGGHHPWIITNALADRFDDLWVVLEEPEPLRNFLARRIRKVGWLEVAGQFCTMVLIKLGKVLLRSRIRRFMHREGVEAQPRSGQRIIRVASVNSDHFRETIDCLRPDVVLLIGCRVMRADTLASMPCPVLNYHAGITPQYRGMNGGYWALARGDKANFGSTVHVVDSGIDTGPVLYQVRCTPSEGDCIMTYAYTLAAGSRSICIAAVEDVLDGTMTPIEAEGKSELMFHPPIWTYLRLGIVKGVW